MFGVVITTIFLTLLALIVIGALYYWWNRDEIEADEARVQAALRAWNIQQQEQAIENQIRAVTRQAVARMMAEARNSQRGMWP